MNFAHTCLFLTLHAHRAVRTRLQEATTWLLNVEEMCQPKATLNPAPAPTLVTPSDTDLRQEEGTGAGEAAMHATAADNTSGVRRKTKEKDRDKSSHAEEGKGRKGRAISPTPLPTQAPSMKGALLSLLLKGKDLGIEVDRELAIIVDTLAAIEKWDTQTSSALLSLDVSQLEPLVAQYRALLDTVVPKIKREAEARNGEVVGEGVSGTPSPLTGPGYIESSSFSCTEGFSKPLDAASSSSSPLILQVNSAQGEGVEREEGLWRTLLRFDSDIQRLANQAAQLGIRPGQQGQGEGAGALASASFMQLLLCQATIQWMGEARRLLYFPSSPFGTHLPSPIPAMPAASDRDPVVTVDSEVSGEKKKGQRKPKADSQSTAIVITAAAAPPDAAQALPQPSPSPSLSWGDCSRYVLYCSALSSHTCCIKQYHSDCTVLYLTVLYCTILNCSVCTALYFTVCWTVLHCTKKHVCLSFSRCY
jgi:hypothetical protein